MRVQAAVLLVLVAALAGCIRADTNGPAGDGPPGPPPPAAQPPPPAPPPPDAPSGPAPRFDAPVLVDPQRAGHEPTVAISPVDGAIYVHARGVLPDTSGDPPSANYLWKSVDAGRTFQRVGTPGMETDQASEGFVAVLPSGRILTAYSLITQRTPVDGTSFVTRTMDLYRSDDGGASRASTRVELPSVHRTWLWADEDTVHLGAMSYMQSFHWSSADGGETWSAPERVYDYNIYNGRLVGNGAGVLVWPWFTGAYEQLPDEGEQEAPWLLNALVSVDGGPWTPFPIAELAGERGSVFAGAAVDEAGTFYVAWASWTESGSGVYYASSADGQAWSDAVTVSEGAGLRLMPWIGSPAAGVVGLVWYQNDVHTGDPVEATGPWYAQYASVTGADTQAPVVVVERPYPEPILDSAPCLQALSCGDLVRGSQVCFDPMNDCPDLSHLRRLDDYLGLDHTADGKAVMAFVATLGFGLPPTEPGEPGHVIVIVED